MSTRDDMIVLYQERYLEKCEQVSDLRWALRGWQILAGMLAAITGVLIANLIWG